MQSILRIFIATVIVITLSSAQYSLTVERIGGAKRFGEENIFRAALVNNGRTINTIEQKLPFDVPFPATYINETTGNFILSYIFDGFVEVYNAKGEKIWKQNFFKEMGPNYERTITVALGTSSVAFLTSDVALPNAVAHRFTLDGAKQWETLLPYSMGYEIAMSPDEQTIVAGSYFVLEDEVRQSASLINTKGLIEGNANILFRKAAFSDDNAKLEESFGHPSDKFIALASEREIVIVLNETKKEFSRAGKQTEGIITDIIWHGKNLIVQESNVITPKNGRFYYSNPTFISYSKELKEISKKQLDNVTFKSSTMKKVGATIELIYERKSIRILDK